jgi:hypothetical protein
METWKFPPRWSSSMDMDGDTHESDPPKENTGDEHQE